MPEAKKGDFNVSKGLILNLKNRRVGRPNLDLSAYRDTRAHSHKEDYLDPDIELLDPLGVQGRDARPNMRQMNPRRSPDIVQ